jgi:hypothetical protein
MEESNKIQQIGGIEGAMLEPEQLLQIIVRMMQDKLIRRAIHQLHQLFRLTDDGGSVAPGEDGRKKTGDLDILF